MMIQYSPDGARLAVVRVPSVFGSMIRRPIREIAPLLAGHTDRISMTYRSARMARPLPVGVGTRRCGCGKCISSLGDFT